MSLKKRFIRPAPPDKPWMTTYDPEADHDQNLQLPGAADWDGNETDYQSELVSQPLPAQSSRWWRPEFSGHTQNNHQLNISTLSQCPNARGKKTGPATQHGTLQLTQRLAVALANFLTAEKLLDGQNVPSRQVKQLFLADPITGAGYDRHATMLAQAGLLTRHGEGSNTSYSSTQSGRNYAAQENLQPTLSEERIKKALGL